MGESPATYTHADAVAELTARVRREHPGALATAIDATPALRLALSREEPGRGDKLAAVVALFQHLTSTDLAHLSERDAVANDVITAALYATAGIDYVATSIKVSRIHGDRYWVRVSDGTTSTDLPVRTPRTPPGAATSVEERP